MQRGYQGTFQRVAGVIERPLGEATFLVDPRRNAIHQLNGVGAAVWAALASPSSFDELAGALRSAFPGAAPGAIEADLRELLEDLLDAQLIAR